MTVNELASKVHLPTAVAHFGFEPPKIFRKLPHYGWYAQTKNEDITFNCVDLFAWCAPERPKDETLITECYEYYTREHPELLETPVRYSETVENKLYQDYTLKKMHERFYRACRAAALTESLNWQARTYKFTDLLQELGMPEFINAGIGLITPEILRRKGFEALCLRDKIDRNLILIPTYFAPNGRIATYEKAVIGDLSTRKAIYLENETGWYGALSTNIVGKVSDLMTTRGTVWNPMITQWLPNKVLNLQASLEPNQCLEIWSNIGNIATDKDPISLIPSGDLITHVKQNIGRLSISQIAALEKKTGEKLAEHWIASKTTETSVSGMRFLSNQGKYYYYKGNIPMEYTNFTLELTRIKKEADEFWQYGTATMNGSNVPFKIKRKHFVSQNSLLKALTNVLLDAGLGIPMVAPNLKHYITNVIESFNPINIIDNPKPATIAKLADKQNVRVLDSDL